MNFEPKRNEPQFNLGRVDEILLSDGAQFETMGFDAQAPVLGLLSRREQRNTQALISRLEGNPHFQAPREDDLAAPYGSYLGRHVIGFGTRIQGGVYMGRKPREAIVVDATSKVVRRLHYKLRLQLLIFTAQHLWTRRGSIDRGQIQREQLKFIMRFVQRTLVFDNHAVTALIEFYGAKHDVKLSLNAFIEARVGVCRHQVCLYGVLVELLQEDGLLGGKVSVQRARFARFSHAWVRFTSQWGQVYIIDPAQDRFANLSEMGEMEREFYSI